VRIKKKTIYNYTKKGHLNTKYRRGKLVK